MSDGWQLLAIDWSWAIRNCSQLRHKYIFWTRTVCRWSKNSLLLCEHRGVLAVIRFAYIQRNRVCATYYKTFPCV